MERANNRRYIRDCKRVLDQSDIVKIGITGSFGKTSVKNILTGILSQKYRVLSTPGSYNTPLGISLTVKKLDATHDIFIAEMGARHVGDISDLAAIVKPQYAVLTGVNTQHLESFGSEEKILETKFELFEGLSPDGVGFFSPAAWSCTAGSAGRSSSPASRRETTSSSRMRSTSPNTARRLRCASGAKSRCTV